MRRITELKENFVFTDQNKEKHTVNLPHTWNNIDGQDGGDDYWRGTNTYETDFDQPKFDKENERVYLQFDGVNASARVVLNDKEVCKHDGGYSTFRADVTDFLKAKNHLLIEVDNSRNERVYPQNADFTFYGGIYRDVTLVVVNKKHFDMDYFGGPGLKYTTDIVDDTEAHVHVECYPNDEKAEVLVTLFDAEGHDIVSSRHAKCDLKVQFPHLWNGLENPYLYKLVCQIVDGETVLDEISCNVGIRSIRFDYDKGFFLNGKSYPLHGVSRHQDRKGLGNAIGKAEMEEDIKYILEVGANTIRLAHYQHNQYFYDLCDKYGLVIWAEIPYISEHMPNEEAKANTISQMHELIVQNYNHPSIVCWGLSNEITIKVHNKKDLLEHHKALNKFVKELDPTRPTVLACYAMCLLWDKVSYITDLVGWNLYLGWYVPFKWLNDLFISFRHLIGKNIPLCYSEFGAEGMPNLHAKHPHRMDNTEEYQAEYHEYMIKCFQRHPYVWANYVWNMYDFAADARNQGGEPGMNHKGLMTFDRKTKKDSFYLYKCYWNPEKMIHICSKRYEYREGKTAIIKVYCNENEVELFNNGRSIGKKTGDHIFKFKVNLEEKNEIIARAGNLEDSAVFFRCDKKKEEYILKKGGSSVDWAKKKK